MARLKLNQRNQEGYWDHRPYDDAMWMPAHYEFRDGEHYLVQGEWE